MSGNVTLKREVFDNKEIVDRSIAALLSGV
jgi:hypothetical protein